jgi:hypothetical protein
MRPPPATANAETAFAVKLPLVRLTQHKEHTVVDLRLETLTVVDKADRLGRDEPMLWTMFVELSLDTLNSHQFVVTTDPLAGKLGKAGKGDTVSIPAAAGRYHRTTGGIFLIGVIAAAFENDLRTKKQIKDGYAAGAAELNQAILDHFATHGFVKPDEMQQAAMGARVAAQVKQAVIAANGLILARLGGTGLGSDNEFIELVGDKLDRALVLDFKAKKDRAVYRVNGKLSFVR